MTRLPMICAVAAGVLIGVVPPAVAAAAPAPNAGTAASTTTDSAPAKSGQPIFVSMMRSMSEQAQSMETVDEHR
jgi:hypothetical protein